VRANATCVKPDIKSRSLAELEQDLAAWGEPKFRAAQLLHWVYQRHAADWEIMTNLPKTLRQRLQANYTLSAFPLVRLQSSTDSTVKFLWRLADSNLIESVLVPASPALYGQPSDRFTLCVSTQIGCAYGCKFCASGLRGWKRNLDSGEIVEQLVAAERWHARQDASACSSAEPPGHTPISTLSQSSRKRLVNNLVIMGMGEPLANYENLLRALHILNAPWGGGIGARKITVSTSGLPRQIRRLAEEPMQLRLAVSLHGATDEIRNRLMPVNRKHPLRELVLACEYYLEKKGRMISLEYVLIAGVNADPSQVRPLAELARRLHAKVNLIPYNQIPGLPWTRPDEARQSAFLAALERLRVPATLRREKGHEISAACGQLRLQTEGS
jgi:23S rRNA (adenine2503-C2)-methyltransferase